MVELPHIIAPIPEYLLAGTGVNRMRFSRSGWLSGVWRIRKRTRALTAAVLLAVFSIGVSAGGIRTQTGDTLLAVAGVPRRLPIYSVGTDEKKVAISFDAAWGAEYTEQLLATLRKYNIKTTFFLCGFWIDKYPEMVKKIAAEGHELGNHTATHPHLNGLSREEIAEELSKVHRQIKDLTGQNAFLFRPPFGEYSNKVIEVAEELGYKTIQWSVDSLDWRDVTPEYIFERVTGQMHKGAIVLFHNNATSTPRALAPILEKLQADGYQIVPISQLLFKGEYYIDHEGTQRPKQKR